jgi:hypothetical protein
VQQRTGGQDAGRQLHELPTASVAASSGPAAAAAASVQTQKLLDWGQGIADGLVIPYPIVTRPLAGYGRVVMVRSPHPNELAPHAKAAASYYGGPVRESIQVSELLGGPPAWAPKMSGE